MDMLGLIQTTSGYEAVVRLLLAALLGAMIGLERELHGRAAGLRTHLLVGLGSTLAMIVSLHFGEVYGPLSPDSTSIQVDPARVAYGVMAGIGFIGAGTIIRHGIGIRGLTTAASLWCTAAVGLACGFGINVIAIFATAVVVFALWGLSLLEDYLPTYRYKDVFVKLPISDKDHVATLEEFFKSRRAMVTSCQHSRDAEHNLETITCRVLLKPRAKQINVRDIASRLPETVEISVK